MDFKFEINGKGFSTMFDGTSITIWEKASCPSMIDICCRIDTKNKVVIYDANYNARLLALVIRLVLLMFDISVYGFNYREDSVLPIIKYR